MAGEPAGRRRWVVIAAAAAGVGFLGVGAALGAAAYAFSSGGFQSIVLPAARSATGWTITATSGRIGLDGSFEATDLFLEAPDYGLQLRARSVQARVQPMSFLGDLPVVELAAVRGADVVLGPAPEAPEDEEPFELRVPVRIDRLAMGDTTLRMFDGTATTAVADAPFLRLKDLRPGATATLDVAANLGAAPGDPTAATDARLGLAGTLAQDEPGTTLTWTGTGTARVRPSVGPDPMRVQTDFALDTSGTASSTDAAGKLSFAATRGPVALGNVRAEATWKGGDTGSLSGEAVFEGLGPSFLNPLLALAAPVQIRTGRVDGKITATTVDTDVKYDATLTGQDLSFQGASGAPTAPVAMTSAESGWFAWDGSVVHVETAGLQVDQAGRRVVTVNLAEPLVLSFGEGAAADAPVARLAVDLDRVALSDLRPWVALSGNDALADVSKGTLQAEVLAAVAEQGGSVRITGSWEARDVVRGDLGPLGVRHDIEMTIDDLSKVSIDPRTASLSYGGRPLATLTPSASYDSETGAMSFSGSVQADDGPEALRRIGVLPSDVGLVGGRLTGKVTFAQASSASEAVAAAKLDIGPTRLADGGKTYGTRSFALDLTAGLDAKMTEARVTKGNVSIDQAGTTGLVSIEGYWPIDDGSARGGRLDIGLHDLEARPWAELFGLVEPGAVKTLPMNGDVIAIQEKGSDQIEIQGKETVGPFVPELGGGRQWTATTLKIDHGGMYTGDAMEGFKLSLVSAQPEKPEGRTDLAGRIAFDDRTGINLTGTATGVDISPFAVLVLGPDEEAASSVSAGGVDLGAYFDFEVPVDVDIVVDLVNCSYFDLPIEQGKLKLFGQRGNLHILLDAPKAAGGSATFAAKLMVTGRNPGFEWSLRADDTDVGALMKAMNYGAPTWVRARGSFASEGSGKGVKTAIGRTLDGTFQFDLADGGFIDTKLLEYIASETGVWGFQRMGFKIARGTVSVEQGRLSLDAAEVWNVETKLAAGGLLYDRDNQEWRINPRVDEATWSKIAPKWNVPPYLMDDGFVSLPIDIKVGGTWAKPKYSVAPRAGLWDDVASGALGALDEQTGLGLGGLAEDLFGIGGDDDEEAPAPGPAPAPTAPPTRPTAQGSVAPAPSAAPAPAPTVFGKPGSTGTRPK